MSTSRTRTAAAAPVAVTSVLVLALLSGCGSSGSTAGTSAAASSSAASVASSSPATRGSASTGGSGSATASSPTVSSPTAASPTAASSGAASAGATAEQEQYCRTSGGQVQTRAPYWNTNGSQNQWLALGGSATMCRFQADDEAKSRIYVDLTTLSSTEPTLAGLAYLSKVPMPASTGGGNPATGYCSKELNGSSTFGGGVSAAGGGWVAQQDPDDVVVSLCVFADGSFIDEWGLAYHSAGEVRGQDLTTVMRYQPSGSLPPVFPSGSAQPTS